MTRPELRAVLAGLDLSQRPEEEPIRARMLALLEAAPACFERACFPAHFTGSALVVDADGSHVLLHHHRKLDKWLQFGGHCDGDPDVLQVAQREAREESGLAGLIVASARPFDLDIHAIPALGAEPPHEHFDVRYMLIAPEKAEFAVSAESRELRWFTAAELAGRALDASLSRMIGKWQGIVARRRHG